VFAITFDVVRWPHVTWVGMLFGLIFRRLPFGRVHSVEPRPTSDEIGSASCTPNLMAAGLSNGGGRRRVFVVWWRCVRSVLRVVSRCCSKLRLLRAASTCGFYTASSCGFYARLLRSFLVLMINGRETVGRTLRKGQAQVERLCSGSPRGSPRSFKFQVYINRRMTANTPQRPNAFPSVGYQRRLDS